MVLAAGRGARLGASGGSGAKPLLAWRGRALVDHALDAARASGCSPVVLVVGHEAEAVADRAPAGVDVVVAPDWADGLSASLRAALDHLEPVPVDAVCVGLADQPAVGPDAYRHLVEVAGRVPDVPIAVATYDGERGNPVLLTRAVWAEARSLTGDAGARRLMDRHPVVEVDCTGTGSPIDVDTVDDLAALDRSAAEFPEHP